MKPDRLRSSTTKHIACAKCGAQFKASFDEEITPSEFSQKMVVIMLGFAVCSLLTFITINVSFKEELSVVRK